VDDDACCYRDPVLQAGHFNRALLGHFSRAPKPVRPSTDRSNVAGVREVSPGFAHRGDPVIARSGRDFQIGVIELNGLIVINSETKGLVFVPRSLATRAWCV
jgi:hypothetical protein